MDDWIIGLAGIAGGALGILFGEHRANRRWAADNERGRWAEIVQLMDVHTDQTKSEEVRKLAWARLNQLGLYDAVWEAEFWHRTPMRKRPPEDYPLHVDDWLTLKTSQRKSQAKERLWSTVREMFVLAAVGGLVAIAGRLISAVL